MFPVAWEGKVFFPAQKIPIYLDLSNLVNIQSFIANFLLWSIQHLQEASIGKLDFGILTLISHSTCSGNYLGSIAGWHNIFWCSWSFFTFSITSNTRMLMNHTLKEKWMILWKVTQVFLFGKKSIASGSKKGNKQSQGKVYFFPSGSGDLKVRCFDRKLSAKNPSKPLTQLVRKNNSRHRAVLQYWVSAEDFVKIWFFTCIFTCQTQHYWALSYLASQSHPIWSNHNKIKESLWFYNQSCSFFHL